MRIVCISNLFCKILQLLDRRSKKQWRKREREREKCSQPMERQYFYGERNICFQSLPSFINFFHRVSTSVWKLSSPDVRGYFEAAEYRFYDNCFENFPSPLLFTRSPSPLNLFFFPILRFFFFFLRVSSRNFLLLVEYLVEIYPYKCKIICSYL